MNAKVKATAATRTVKATGAKKANDSALSKAINAACAAFTKGEMQARSLADQIGAARDSIAEGIVKAFDGVAPFKDSDELKEAVKAAVTASGAYAADSIPVAATRLRHAILLVVNGFKPMKGQSVQGFILANREKALAQDLWVSTTAGRKGKKGKDEKPGKPLEITRESAAAFFTGGKPDNVADAINAVLMVGEGSDLGWLVKAWEAEKIRRAQADTAEQEKVWKAAGLSPAQIELLKKAA